MRQIPSAEFRRAYPALQEPVEVTALGRVIGRWIPAGITVAGQEVALTGEPPSLGSTTHSFGSSRPAPKPGSKK